jgi:hypothetical protein
LYAQKNQVSKSEILAESQQLYSMSQSDDGAREQPAFKKTAYWYPGIKNLKRMQKCRCLAQTAKLHT